MNCQKATTTALKGGNPKDRIQPARTLTSQRTSSSARKPNPSRLDCPSQRSRGAARAVGTGASAATWRLAVSLIPSPRRGAGQLLDRVRLGHDVPQDAAAVLQVHRLLPRLELGARLGQVDGDDLRDPRGRPG